MVLPPTEGIASTQSSRQSKIHDIMSVNKYRGGVLWACVTTLFGVMTFIMIFTSLRLLFVGMVCTVEHDAAANSV